MTEPVIQEQIVTQVDAGPVVPDEATPTPEEAVPEAVVPEEAPVETPEDAADAIWEKRMSAFTKQDADNRQQIQDLKAQLTQFQDFEKLRDSDPLAAMSKVGLNVADIVDRSLGMETKPDPMEEMLVRVEKMEQARASELEAQTAARTASAESDFRKNIGSTIESQTDKFTLCSSDSAQAINDAYAVIDYEYQRNGGKIIEITEALRIVEDSYAERYLQFAAAKKQGIPAPVQATPEVKATAPQLHGTLTQQTNSNAPIQQQSTVTLTDADRMNRAIAALEFKD